jgi:hypothetical protein
VAVGNPGTHPLAYIPRVDCMFEEINLMKKPITHPRNSMNFT